MGFTEIFWKYMMKNVYLPKINILVLTHLEQWQNYKDLYGVTGAWKGQYLIPKLQQEFDFWQVHIPHHVLSEYLSKSHNFKIYFFVMSHLSIVSFAAVIRVVTQRSSPLMAAHSSSAFLSLKLTNKEQTSISWKPGLCRQM